MSTLQFSITRVDSRSLNFRSAARALAQDCAKHPDIRRVILPGVLHEEMIDSRTMKASITGSGVAILPISVKGLPRPILTCTRLMNPVNIKASDGQACDILCTVLMPQGLPTSESLPLLAHISRSFKDKAFCERIRSADTSDALEAMMIAPEGWLIAA